MTVNPDSILDSTKQYLGLDTDNTAFDLDVMMSINSAFGSLHQLGITTVDSFEVADSTTLWSTYISNLPLLGLAKSFVYLTSRLIFDPPATSFALDAVQKQIEQYGWRINVAAEELYPPSDPTAGSFSESGVFISATDPGSVPDGSVWFDTE